MKMHIGVDSRRQIVHSASASAASICGLTVIPLLLRGAKCCAREESTRRGRREFIVKHALRPGHMTDWCQRFAGRVNPIVQRKNRHESQVRTKVEHLLLGIIERIFDVVNERSRGIANGAERPCAAWVRANFSQLRRSMLRFVTQQRTARVRPGFMNARHSGALRKSRRQRAIPPEVCRRHA